jgi:hypothetical protein
MNSKTAAYASATLSMASLRLRRLVGYFGQASQGMRFNQNLGVDKTS